MRKSFLPWSIAVVIFAVDRFSKLLVQQHVTDPIQLPGFQISNITNTGITWGMLRSYPIIPTVVSVIAVIWICYYLLSAPKVSRVWQFIFGLILAGALGNLTDRIFYGAVIDWIDLGWWPVFNIADSAIVIAMALIVWQDESVQRLFQKKHSEKKK